MKKEKLICKETFCIADADLLMEFLRKKAEEGWKYVKGSGAGGLGFVKREPAERIFRWECLPHNEKGAPARRIQREIIERQRRNGWEYEGSYGPLLIFSAGEERGFEHWGGENGKKDNIFGWLGKEKNRVLFYIISFGAGLLYMLSKLFVSVQVDEYLEWGFSGAFCLLYDNTSVAAFLIFLFAFVTCIISFVELPSVGREKKKVEDAIQSGRKVFYGNQDEYERRKKQMGRRTLTTRVIAGVLLLIFWLATFAVSTFAESVLLLILVAIILVIACLIGKVGNERRWGSVKMFFAILAGMMTALFIGLPAIMSIDENLFDPDDASEWASIEEEYTYPPSSFGLNSCEDMEWTAEKSGSIFGTYESLDVYHLQYDEQNPFDYNYYRYTASTDAFADILRRQALANLEPYDAEKMTGELKGWTCYRIEWDADTEQWFYTDTMLLMKEREIILVNCYLEEIPIEKVLEIFLSNSPLLMI